MIRKSVVSLKAQTAVIVTAHDCVVPCQV